jgi:hypothetical protein
MRFGSNLTLSNSCAGLLSMPNSGYSACMRTVTGRVVGNTVVLDEPIPEGTEVQVTQSEGVYVDDETERELLASIEDANTNGTIPADDVFAEIKRKRSA